MSDSHYHGAASKAIDGNTDAIFAHNSCTRTKSYWVVAFHNVILVEAVIVTNRAVCCGELLGIHSMDSLQYITYTFNGLIAVHYIHIQWTHYTTCSEIAIVTVFMIYNTIQY